MMSLIALMSLIAMSASPLAAQGIVYQTITEDIVEVPATGSDRFVEAHPAVESAPGVAAKIPVGIASYGPFRVLDSGHAALVDATNERSPGQFTAMLHAFPGIRTIELVECPGTDDDRANLRLGMMIHAEGMTTHVPDGGSVRSGAVELFLAGARHVAEPGAEFAVHSWADEFGLEPKDYPANAPENRVYIDYYREMGMNEAEARSFYAMTNSVPNKDAKWLTTADMAHWVRVDVAPPATPKLDSGLAVN
ncbi:MAG: alpha/beta hydrolase [Novosphingobium sp.]